MSKGVDAPIQPLVEAHMSASSRSVSSLPHCNTLQHTAIYCSTLQHLEVCSRITSSVLSAANAGPTDRQRLRVQLAVSISEGRPSASDSHYSPTTCSLETLVQTKYLPQTTVPASCATKQLRATKVEVGINQKSKSSVVAVVEQVHPARKWTKRVRERKGWLSANVCKEFPENENCKSSHFVEGTVKKWDAETDRYTLMYNDSTPLDNDTEELEYQEMKMLVNAFNQERGSLLNRRVIKEFNNFNTGRHIGGLESPTHTPSFTMTMTWKSSRTTRRRP